ncbi:MAG: hypothetical protein MZU97_21230 [Bacillus subtilis]|nr:hypothetical protein [Bacillus subtilis]
MDRGISCIETPSGTRETTIRVPFSPESTLSGVDVEIGIHDRLIYQRDVVLPNDFRQGRLILHFDAVDQEADVFVNRRLAIHHLGGYTPFEVDITAFVEGDVFSLQVFVQDVTDTGDRQTGKQRFAERWYLVHPAIRHLANRMARSCSASVRRTHGLDAAVFRQ